MTEVEYIVWDKENGEACEDGAGRFANSPQDAAEMQQREEDSYEGSNGEPREWEVTDPDGETVQVIVTAIFSVSYRSQLKGRAP